MLCLSGCWSQTDTTVRGWVARSKWADKWGKQICDAKCVGEWREPEVWVLAAAFCVIPKAVGMGVLGPMRGEDEGQV